MRRHCRRFRFRAETRSEFSSLGLWFLIGVVLVGIVVAGSSRRVVSAGNGAPGTGLAGGFSPPEKPTVKPPNLLLINVDDMSTWSMDSLPRIQKFFEKGVNFTSVYVPNPLCCPSRASLLTGSYPHSIDFWFNGESRAHMMDRGGARAFHARGLQHRTFAPRLKEKGYTTGLIGKYLNGYGGSLATQGMANPPGWDDWHATTAEIHNAYYGYDLIENGRRRSYGLEPKDYSTDVFARKAVRFITLAGELERPWFLYFAPFAPHGPRTSADRHLHLYSDLQAPRPPSFGVPGTAKPLWIRDQADLTSDSIAQIDEQFAETARSLVAVDEAFQELIDRLESTGQLERTVVIFTSDNGYSFGLHNWRKKQTYYDQAARVNLAILDPRDEDSVRGRDEETLVTQPDLFPTLLEYAGFSREDLEELPIDGKSLVPLIRAQVTSQDFRDAILLESRALRLRFNDCTPAPPGPFRQTCDLPDYEGGVFDTGDGGRWKYIRLNHRGQRDLLDLRNDPFELENLIDVVDPKFVEELDVRLNELLGKSGGG